MLHAAQLYASQHSAQGRARQGLDPQKNISQYVHESWQIREGLPQNSVQSITQTKDGYLWFSTQEGIVRFDGARFLVYNKKNSTLPENYCNSLVADSAGVIWAATQTQGIIALKNGVFTLFNEQNGLSSNFTPENARALAVSADGSLWVATLGGGINRVQNNRIRVYSQREGLSSDNVQTLLLRKDGTLWVGTDNGINVLNTHSGAIHSITPPVFTRGNARFDNSVQVIVEDNTQWKGLWMGTTNGLLHFQNGTWTRFTINDGLPHNHIRTLYFDSYGTLWIGTLGGGIARLRNGVFSSFGVQDGLTHPDIFDIYEDREGSLYIGTGGGGLNRLRNGTVTVFSRRLGLADPWSILEDTHGNMWFSMFSNGVSVVKSGTGEVIRYSTENGLPSNNAHGMMQDRDGSMWLGTRDKGMCHVVGGKIVQRYGVKDGLPNERIRVFLRDKKGRLWIGTDKGASCFDGGVFTNYGKNAGLVDGRTPVLHEDSHGRIWIGTRQGLFVLENDRVIRSYTTHNGMTGDNIIYLYEDNDNVFWIGTTNGGLHRLKNDSIAAYTTHNGLFDDSVFAILEDEHGWLWMSSSNGIFRVRKSELNDIAAGRKQMMSCVVYGREDGMASPECNGASQPAAWKSRDGRLWFPTIAGVVVIHPSNLVKNILEPNVLIEDVVVNSKALSRTILDSMLTFTRATDNSTTPRATDQYFVFPTLFRSRSFVELPPTAEKFEFHYTATCLTAANRVKFKYMLEGYDRTWVEAGTLRTAYYTNLPRDRSYRFRIIACNNDGIWNEVGASVGFMILPYWYETWQFNLSCSIALIIFAVVAYRWRTHSLRQKALSLERTVQERTQDLHHANQEIQRQVELLRMRAEEIEETNVQLSEANENLQSANTALDEANKFKTQMLSMASHDLKNPLTTILLAAKSVRTQMHDNDDAQEMMDMIRESADMMLTLVTEILDQAALQHGQLDIGSEQLDLSALCFEIVHEYRYRAQNKNIHIEENIEPECYLHGDSKRLRQVMDNLISNAVKYSPNNTQVDVRLFRQTKHNGEAWTRLEVQDQGPGLSEKDRNKLFGFFQRLSPQPTGGESSTGVGLAIVKQIVELHKGSVWCESEVGRGSTFIVELPS